MEQEHSILGWGTDVIEQQTLYPVQKMTVVCSGYEEFLKDNTSGNTSGGGNRPCLISLMATLKKRTSDEELCNTCSVMCSTEDNRACEGGGAHSCEGGQCHWLIDVVLENR